MHVAFILFRKFKKLEKNQWNAFNSLYLRRNVCFIVQGRSYLSIFMLRYWFKDRSNRHYNGERERERDERALIHTTGIRNALLSFRVSDHSRATWLLTVVHDPRVRPSLSSLAMSHLAIL